MNTRIIFGPPGTGKTTTLLSILEQELKSGVHPTEIAYVSFTKEGAEQGISRAIDHPDIGQKFGYTREDFPYFRTLHSLAFRQNEMQRNNVLQANHYKEFSALLSMNFVGYYSEDMRNDDDKYLFYLDLLRNNAETAHVYENDLNIQTLSYVRENFNRYKKAYGLYDYTDMIEGAIKRAAIAPVKVAIVDEAQDLTTLQWQFVWSTFRDVERIYIAGDDDQAIYQWSGADVGAFLGVQGNRQILAHSYRLPDNILEVSKKISDQISLRVDKQFSGTGKTGTITAANSAEDITINNGESYLFLSRNNWYLKEVEEAVRFKGVPYVYKGAPSIKPSRIKDINRWEEARKKGVIEPSVRQALSLDLKKDAALHQPWYEAFNWPLKDISHYRDVVKSKRDPKNIQVRISTIHRAKGAEADNVILLLDMSATTAKNLERNPDAEHRVFYVGATRAKKSLTLVLANSKHEYPMQGMTNEF